MTCACRNTISVGMHACRSSQHAAATAVLAAAAALHRHGGTTATGFLPLMQGHAAVAMQRQRPRWSARSSSLGNLCCGEPRSGSPQLCSGAFLCTSRLPVPAQRLPIWCTRLPRPPHFLAAETEMPWHPLLTREELLRGLAYFGSGARLHRLARKLLAGKPIKASRAWAGQAAHNITAADKPARLPAPTFIYMHRLPAPGCTGLHAGRQRDGGWRRLAPSRQLLRATLLQVYPKIISPQVGRAVVCRGWAHAWQVLPAPGMAWRSRDGGRSRRMVSVVGLPLLALQPHWLHGAGCACTPLE